MFNESAACDPTAPTFQQAYQTQAVSWAGDAQHPTAPGQAAWAQQYQAYNGTGVGQNGFSSHLLAVSPQPASSAPYTLGPGVFAPQTDQAVGAPPLPSDPAEQPPPLPPLPADEAPPLPGSSEASGTQPPLPYCQDPQAPVPYYPPPDLAQQPQQQQHPQQHLLQQQVPQASPAWNPYQAVYQNSAHAGPLQQPGWDWQAQQLGQQAVQQPQQAYYPQQQAAYNPYAQYYPQAYQQAYQQPAPYPQPGITPQHWQQPQAAAAPAQQPYKLQAVQQPTPPTPRPSGIPPAAAKVPSLPTAPLPEDAPDSRPATPLHMVDAAELFLKPGREHRPKRIAVIMRGLPGSGKTHVAKKLRAVEVEQGGEAPRIHAIDDYFVTEVEKEVEDEAKAGRKKRVREMEYCYEAELERTYQRNLLKAFSRTVEEGRFAFVIVDAPNITVADFKEFWAAGQRAGYEVFVLQPLTSDPQVCFTRNVHRRSLADIQALARKWERTPVVYPQLDVTSLFAKKTKQGGIAEVEMADDSDAGSDLASDDAEAVTAAKRTTRWGGLDEASSAATKAKPRPSKRAKPAKAGDGYDGLTDGLDGLLDPDRGKGSRLQSGTTGKKARRGGLLRGPASGRRVKWADEAPAPGGFHLGGQRLETVYVLEGLGPPPQDGDQSLAGKSFAEQVKKDHASEQHLLRDMMFGGSKRSVVGVPIK